MTPFEDDKEFIKNPHDAAFKSALGDPEIARPFFQDSLPEDVLRHLDLRHLKPVNSNFVDEALKDRHADLVFETRLKGKQAFIYLLFEHQSSPDPWMAFRLLQYILNIWMDFRKQNPSAAHLPAVLPMVLYHGKQPWKAPTQFREMVEAPDDLAGFIPDFRYHLFDLGAIPDQLSAFGKEARVRVRLYLFRHIWDDDFWERFGEAAELLSKGDESILMDYLRWALRYGFYGRDEDAETAKQKIERETRRIGNERIRRMAMSTAERIRQEGIKKGKIEGKIGLLNAQMASKFGSVPDTIQRYFFKADDQRLDRFAAEIFRMDTLDEVKKWWTGAENGR